MDPARIVELLRPFLEVSESHPRVPHPSAFSALGREPVTTGPDPCHSERTSVPEASPARSRRESAFLTPSQLQNILTYIDLLLRWNARINLTAIRDPEEIVTRHFGESLFAARCLFPKAAPQRVPHPARLSQGGIAHDEQLRTHDLIDLGSGAGFPGLPMKIWAPHVRLTLIESNQKKATFLREAIRALTLTDINVFSARAEDFPERAAVVTLRAVERFEAVLPIAAGLVAPGGSLALLIGRSQADRALQLLPSFRWSDPIPVPLSASRILLTGTVD